MSWFAKQRRLSFGFSFLNMETCMRCQRMRVFKVIMSLLRIGSMILVFESPGRETLDSDLGSFVSCLGYSATYRWWALAWALQLRVKRGCTKSVGSHPLTKPESLITHGHQQ